MTAKPRASLTSIRLAHRLAPLSESAAFIVSCEHRDGAWAVASDLEPAGKTPPGVNRVLAEIVRQWGSYEDGRVASALDAWDRNDCRTCALCIAMGHGSACLSHKGIK